MVVVELGNDWLKVIHVQPSAAGDALSKVRIEKLDASVGASPKLIGDIFRQHKLTGLPVYASLPRQLVNVRMLELPSTDPLELSDMVDLQVGKQTPYSRDEIIADYRITGPGREGYTRVLLAIVQRSVLRQRFSVFEEAGIDVERMSLSTEGILGWCRRSLKKPGEGAMLVVDVDSFYSDFVVVDKGNLLFTRSVLLGANELLGDYAAAQGKFVREVRQSVEAFAAESPGLSVGKGYLSGAGAWIPGLAQDLARGLNIVVEPVDSLQAFKYKPKTPDLRQAPYNAVSLTALVGIAGDPASLELSLAPESVRLRRAIVTKARRLTTLGVMIVTVLASISLFATVKLSFKLSRMKALQSELKATTPRIRAVEQMRDIVRVVSERADLRFSAFSVLTAIHTQTGGDLDVALDSVAMDLEDNQVQLGGTGGSTKDIRALVRNLEGSELFRDVKEGGETVRERNGRYRFRLLCQLEKRDDS